MQVEWRQTAAGKPVVGRTKTASHDLDSPSNASQPYTRYSVPFDRASSFFFDPSVSSAPLLTRNRISPDKWRGNDKILWEMEKEREREKGGIDGLQIQSRHPSSSIPSRYGSWRVHIGRQREHGIGSEASPRTHVPGINLCPVCLSVLGV